MNATQLVAAWLKQIADLVLGVGSAPGDETRGNTTLFPVIEARLAGATVGDLADFLIKAFRAYSVRAARIGLHGWFYAWNDEISGTIRCSVSTVLTPRELPFSCTLDIRDDPETIAEAALASPYASGIPSSELEELEWADIDPAGANLVLPVFVKRLVA